MHKHFHSWILLISICLSVTGCSFFMSDEEPIAFKASAPAVAVTDHALALPASPDKCQLNCANKSGLKKKFCLKKCQLAIKKDAIKEASPQTPSLAPSDP